MRQGLPVLIILLILLCSTLSSGEEKSKKAEVLGLLLAYEYEASKEDWDQIGPEARSILMEIIDDAVQPKIVRARAIYSLQYFPDEISKQFLLALVFKEKQDEMFVRKGLYSLSNAFGKEVLDDIGRFLNHKNPDIREASVRAIGKIVSKKSLKLLKKKLRVEKNEMVREVLKKEIKHLKALLKKKND